MPRTRLEVSRGHVLAFRRRVGALDERLPAGADSMRRAAWAGLQDSMPRAALLSIHARVEGTRPSSWEDPALVQLWSLRYSAYVVPAQDIGVFSLGRLSDNPAKRRFAEEMAARIAAVLDGAPPIDARDLGRAVGVHPNGLRYAAPTGTLLIRWDGAHQPTVWTVPRPAMAPEEARLDLARRYLHVFGPGTPAGFEQWAGIRAPAGRAAFEALAGEITPVTTPIGEGWIMAADEDALLASPSPAAPARLLPSGDTYYLLWGADRTLLVPNARQRAQLWTSRVWPGAVLAGGEIVGTWRRSDEKVTIQTWRSLSPAEHEAVETEAASLPLPGLRRSIIVRWEVEPASLS